MELTKLKSVLEALILAAEEPLTLSAMMLVLEQDGVTNADIETAIEDIRTKYNQDNSVGFYLAEIAGGYQFRTKPETADYIQRLNLPKASKLSQASLETLAIIAYRQPIVRSEIEDIRGVDSGGVLKTLLERNLIKIIGKRDEPGSPLIYATTSKFLDLFNLNSLKDLPTLREYEELEKEHYKGTASPEETKPILEEVQASPFEQKWSQEDDTILHDLTDSIKHLKRLEKEIFPKPVETLVAVLNPNAGMPTAPIPSPLVGEGQGEGENDEGTSTENSGAGN